MWINSWKTEGDKTEVAGACCETGRGLCWNAEVCSWEKEERQTEEMLRRLHQGRSEESGNGKERCGWIY